MGRVEDCRDDDAPILEVEDLTKRYGTHLAVDSASFAVADGEIFAILGPNGSGKSSTLHCIVGILPLDSGTIRIDGYDQSRPEAKMSVGFVPDDLALPQSLTGAEFLAFVRRLQPATDIAWRDFLISELGLGDVLSRFLAEYSHGMKRKIQVVAALAHMPTLLILDEPYRGLDPEAAVILRELIRTFVDNGGAALVTTHDLLAAESYFDRICIMANGRTVAGGQPCELRERYGRESLEDVFLSVVGLEQVTSEARQRIAARWPKPNSNPPVEPARDSPPVAPVGTFRR